MKKLMFGLKFWLLLHGDFRFFIFTVLHILIILLLRFRLYFHFRRFWSSRYPSSHESLFFIFSIRDKHLTIIFFCIITHDINTNNYHELFLKILQWDESFFSTIHITT